MVLRRHDNLTHSAVQPTKNHTSVELSPSAPPANRDAKHLSDLLHLIYDAGLHPERWNAVVSAVAQSMDSTKALLFTPYIAPQHGGMLFPHGIDEKTLQLWGSHYIEHDIWAQRMQERDMWSDGGVFLDHEMVPMQEFLASRFYREFLSTINIGRVCEGMVFAGAPGLPATSLGVFRDITDPEFTDADRQWLKLLVSHVSRSLGIMHRLDTARLSHTSVLAAFDRLHFGVALLNEQMAVLHLNDAARSVMARNDGLSVNARRQLESGGGAPQAAGVSRWLAGVKDASAREQAHLLDGCRVPRKGGTGQYMVQCSAIPADGMWQAGDDAVRYVVFIVDPDALRMPDAARLIALYGLTRTQARVALAIASGSTYKQVANDSGVTLDTVNSFMKEIYAKTRVHRQADLVRLVLSLGQASV